LVYFLRYFAVFDQEASYFLFLEIFYPDWKLILKNLSA